MVKVGWQEDGYGKYIVIQDGNFQFYYCHLAGVFIKPGDPLPAGEPIALMGSTGNSTGPHLHFAIRLVAGGGYPGFQGYVNPMPLLREAKQPILVDITSLDLDDFTPGELAAQTTTIKPQFKQAKGKPVTHGKRTMYPRMKYF